MSQNCEWIGNCKLVSVCHAISVQQQARGRLQILYVRGNVVLRAHTVVRVVFIMSGNSYPNHHIGDPANASCKDPDPSTRSEQPPDSTFTINRVSIRVPPFWFEKPAVWFAQLEGQFAFVGHHAGRNKILLHLRIWYQICGEGGWCHNQPPTRRP